MVFLIIFVFFIFVILYIYWYNKLSSSRQDVVQAWSDIDVQLNRRHDLIPNLVRVVTAYASHEKNILEKTTQLRTKALSLAPTDIQEKETVEKDLGENMQSLLGIAEAYPDLKANDEFLKLQQELVITEDEIASARRIYNGNVARYNILITTFPTNIIAKLHHFIESKFFQKV